MPLKSVSGSGPLVFGFGVSGSLYARRSGGSIVFVNAAGRVVLRYGDLSATDARGRALASVMSVRDGRVLLRVNASGARYPITVDPLVQVAKLTASDGQASDSLGETGGIAVSVNTVVVGAAGATVGGNVGQGAAYVFTAGAGGWATATQAAVPEILGLIRASSASPTRASVSPSSRRR